MIDIEDFITSQQVTWVKKANKLTSDVWSFNLKNLCNGNCLTLGGNIVNGAINPILYNLASSYEKFVSKFYTINDNYKGCFLLNNPNIVRERGSTQNLNMEFFRQNPPINEEKIPFFKFSDFWEGNGPKLLETINLTLDVNINLVTYLRICTALGNFHRSLKRDRITDNSTLYVGNFLNSFNKGSKSIRRVLGNNVFVARDQTVYRTFLRLTNISQIEDSEIEFFYSTWYMNTLPNRFREFLFKFINNSLPLNTRLSHFVIDISRNCTFCTLKNRRADETFGHLFFECETVRSLHTQFEGKFLEIFPNINSQARNVWFTGSTNGIKNLFLKISVLTFQFCIWEYKLKKKIPVFNSIITEFFHLFNQCFKVSREIQYDRPLLNFPLSRDWSTLRDRYGDG